MISGFRSANIRPPRASKPPALPPGGTIRIVSPASPTDPKFLARGVAELKRQGYRVLSYRRMKPDFYFAGTAAKRAAELEQALCDPKADAVICARGGYGSAGVLEELRLRRDLPPKLLIGYSDMTVLQTYLWQRFRWPTLIGPMIAYGWAQGSGRREGYDLKSFQQATSGAEPRWDIPLRGQVVRSGTASGTLLGGCLTLLQDSLGTPWELDTRGAILLLEDVSVRPYKIDRMLVHLLQAGKFRGVRGIILGEFPNTQHKIKRGEATAWDVCRRVLRPLDIPIVFGAPIGHTSRPMLTVPLGVRVRLRARGEGKLEILESPVEKPEKTNEGAR